MSLPFRIARGALSALAFASLALPSAAAPKAPHEIPVADFYRVPAVSGMTLSPDGLRFAVVIGLPNGRKGLAVAEVSKPKHLVGIAQFDDADVAAPRWVNPNRIAFSAVDYRAPLGDQRGSGLYAVDIDSKDFKNVILRNWGFRASKEPAIPPLKPNFGMVAPLRGAGDEVLGIRFVNFNTELVRINTRDLTWKSVPSGSIPRGAGSWVTDPTGAPRALVAYDNDAAKASVYWRDAREDWVKLTEYSLYDPPTDGSAFTPVAVDYAGNLFISAIGDNPGRTSALYRYDPVARKRDDKPVVSTPGFDFDGSPIFDTEARQLIGFNFNTETAGQVWLAPRMKEVQAAVDKLLPSTNNVLQCGGPCLSAKTFLVTAYTSRQPPLFLLFDRESNKLTVAGNSMPWLDPTLLAEQDMVRIKARDGLEIPVYYTKPKGKGPFPTVVLVHGGPWARNEWADWSINNDAQFLASRGYLVVEPEFRSSIGYGDKLYRSGWKQWGLAMQDDITDATHWAIKQGLADPKRIAIAGASYGGYATMMGLVKEPDLYKAGINWVGVTDIELMYDIGWSDFAGSTYSRLGMPVLIGDRKKDAEQLRKTSPLQRAAEIKQPVLMAYGELDFRVPLPHGEKMRDALIKSGNKNVELKVYDGEGHGFLLEANRVDFASRVERFLATHLK